MSTSKLSGYSEECSSCESGWTKYLVSDDNGEAEFVLVDSGDEDRNGGSDKDTDDDDDSMASDASTGLVNNKQKMDQHFKLGDDGEESAQCSSQSDESYQVEVSNRRKCEPQTELNSTSLYGKSKDMKKMDLYPRI